MTVPETANGGLADALDDVRVLTLPGRAAQFCGYLLGQLGARVTKVRDADLEDGPAATDYDLAYDRDAVIEYISLADGADRLERLVRTSDIVVTDIADASPVIAAAAGGMLNAAVIHIDISTFGITGPLGARAGGDLIATAASGFLLLTGTPGEEPVRMGADQALKLAGAEAAAAAMIALHYRDATGIGQHVDVAARDAMIRATVFALPKYRYEGVVQSRVGDRWGVREKPLKSLWRCADGWASFVRRGGALGGRVNHATVSWIAMSGMDVGTLDVVNWDAIDLGDENDRALIDRLDELFEEFLTQRTVEYAFREGLRRGITIAPVRTLDDVLREPHFVDRGYWAEAHVDGISMRVPGFLVKDSGARVKETAQ